MIYTEPAPIILVDPAEAPRPAADQPSAQEQELRRQQQLCEKEMVMYSRTSGRDERAAYARLAAAGCTPLRIFPEDCPPAPVAEECPKFYQRGSFWLLMAAAGVGIILSTRDRK